MGGTVGSAITRILLVMSAVAFSADACAASAAGTATSEAQGLIAPVVQTLLKSTSAVVAYAKTPDDEKIKQDSSILFNNVSVEEDLSTTRGHSKATASAARELFTKNTVNPTAQVFFANGPPEGAAFAFAKANSLSEADVQPPGLIPFKDLLALNISLRSDSPSVFAVSLSNLADANYDKNLLDKVSSVNFLGTDPSVKLSGGLSALGLTPAIPLITYISVFAYLDGDKLQVNAIDYLGNTLLTASNFSLSSSDGTTSATFSGEISTNISIPSGQPFFQNLEAYSATAALTVPEPSTFILFAFGLLGLYMRRRAPLKIQMLVKT
jgi:hypothetical protein